MAEKSKHVHSKLATHWPFCEICGAAKANTRSYDGYDTCVAHYIDITDVQPDPPRVPRFSHTTGKPLESGGKELPE